MNLARRGLEDPERLVELEQQLETKMAEVLAEAGDAGYSSAEVLVAFKLVCERQHKALLEDPDPADDPALGAHVTGDIRDARFYVVDEDNGGMAKDAEPLEFDPAYQKACALVENGVRVKVLYTEEASQIQITRFVSHGIATEIVSGA
jgi:hypothetical protein